MKRLTKRILSILMALTLIVGVSKYEGEHTYVHAEDMQVQDENGRIKDAQLKTIYTLETTEEMPYVVVEFTPTKAGTYIFNTDIVENFEYFDGYGYLYDDNETVESQIANGKANIEAGYIEYEDIYLDDAIYEGDDESETGRLPRFEAELTENITYYFVLGGYDGTEFGKALFDITCAHADTEIRNDTLSDCSTGGYTGDKYCLACDELVEEGYQVEAGSHAEQILDESTVIEVTCTSNGYSGDYICPECGKVLEEGQVIETEGHISSEDVSGAYDASCYSDGYTGDIICQNCPEVLTKGTSIDKLTHEYENDACKHCGRITNAQLNTQYDSYISENVPFQVIDFTPSVDGEYQFYGFNDGDYWDGYGYLYNDEDIVEEQISQGISLIQSGKGGYLRLSSFLKDSDDEGDNRLPAITYDLEADTTYYFVVGSYDYFGYDSGDFSVIISCMHRDTEFRNRTLEDCSTGGYTGDIYCLACDELVEEGVEIEPNSEHDYFKDVIKKATCKTYAEVEYTCIYCDYSYTETDTEDGYGPCNTVNVGYVRPTCTTPGYSGDRICKDCGYVEDIGLEIPPYHDQTDEDGNNYFFCYGYQSVDGTCTVDGYSGDTICTICREVIEEGETYPAPGHDFEDGVCTNCGLDEDFLAKDENEYYLIYTADDLMEFIKYADTGINGKLMEDITLPDNYQNDDWDYECAYNTILDGNAHTIENFNIDGYWFALFDSFDNSTVKNLTVVCNIEEHPDHSFGAIAQYAIGATFENCTVNGEIVSTEEVDDFGGYVGEAYECIFRDCINNANISVEGGNVGGFVGYGEYNTFINCINNGNIHGYEDEIGGIAGESDYSLFENCTNNGDITTEDEQAAGIVGVVYGSNIIDCKNTGDITYIGTDGSQDEIGGIVGAAYEGSIIDGCENSGFIGNEDPEVYIEEVGGIVGQIFDWGTITNCVNNGNVTAGGYNVGGIVGDVDYSYCDNYSDIVVKISNCINNGDIYGTDCVGGIAGYSQYTTITNCTNNGNITGIINVAGISGYAGYAIIDKVYNTGTVEGCDEDNTAGLVHGTEDDAVITNSDGNHTTHNYVENILQPGTFTSVGKVEFVCGCGAKREGTIDKLGDVTLSQTTYDYTGKAIVLPAVAVKTTSGSLVDAKYYTITYLGATGKAVTTITEAGTYTVKITFKGAYAGEITKTITVNKAAETPTAVTNPAKVKITKAKNVKVKKVKLAWKKVTDANGYEVRYATNKKFNKAKVKKIKKNIVKYTLKKLNKKKYFIQVRAYKVIDGVKYVGKWSKKVNIKITK